MTKLFTDEQVRDFFFHCPEHKIDAMKISGREREILAYVRRTHGVGSKDVADVYGVSVQNASTTLKRLLEKGYLKRVEVLATTGGLEYIYTWS